MPEMYIEKIVIYSKVSKNIHSSCNYNFFFVKLKRMNEKIIFDFDGRFGIKLYEENYNRNFGTC